MSEYFNSELIIKDNENVLERVGNEIVIISFSSGKYYSAKGLATDIILLIENRVPSPTWENKLKEYYSNEAITHSKINKFLEELVKNNLCIGIEELKNSDYKLPTDFERNQHDEPVLKIYDDLHDIIMVDPIHDTSLEGWPEKNGE